MVNWAKPATLALIWLLLFQCRLVAYEQLSAGNISTTEGIVAGIVEQGARHFRGIPYAQPPSGELRWQPPKSALAWQGIRQSTSFGANCPQKHPKDNVTRISAMSEDCLTLNISIPNNISADTKLPVLVWIHGGGLVAGSGASAVFGSRVWNESNIIFVSFNYRLGALGFFAHPSLDNRLGANFGLMDMTAALGWLDNNIESFGGDRERLTIMGVSAGAMGVQLLMVNPQAKGLFSAAIAQSGYGTWPKPRTRAVTTMKASPSAEAIAINIANKASRNTSTKTLDRAQLLTISADSLVNAVEGFHLPLVDGITLPEESALMFAKGLQHKVPFMTGGNSFDGSVFPLSNISNESVLTLLNGDQNRVSELYKNDFQKSELRGISRIFGDMRYVFASYYMAQQMENVGQAAYLYLFDPNPNATKHAAAAINLFDRENKKIVTMRQYWINFINSHDPNMYNPIKYAPNKYAPNKSVPKSNLVHWPKQKPGQNQWMVFTEEPVIKNDLLKEKIKLLKKSYLRRVTN